MTSLPIIGREQQHLEGRTVRDIVEYNPGQVSEVWCRKIFRQILQSLELQYAMHMPHRAITPDTIVFHDNGEPLLVPSDIPDPCHDGSKAPEDCLRDDLTALASIVHYAVTRELQPTGPLRGRAIAGYSESLLGAVDLCMAPDLAERPRTIETLRDLLGIVALGPAIPPASLMLEAESDERTERAPLPPFAASPFAAQTAEPEGLPPSFTHEPPVRRTGSGIVLTRWQRWTLAAGGAAMLVALAVTVFATLRDSASYDNIALRLPQQAEGGGASSVNDAGHAAALPAPPQAAPAGAAQPAAASAPAPAPSASAQAFAEGAMGASGASGAAGATGTEPPQDVAPDAAARPAAAPAAGAGTGYRLQIQPWGTVYVDGVDRGVSPPVKRLVLAPGHHTIRVTNPNYNDRVLDIESTGGDGRIAVDFSTESPH